MDRIETDEATLVLANSERGRRMRGLAWIAGVIVAVAAVAMVFSAMSLSSDKAETEGHTPAGATQAERAATAYVNAYAKYDRTRLKSLLADDASGFWRLTARLQSG